MTFPNLRYLAAAIAFASTAAFACACTEFTHATAVMASPTMGSAYVSFVAEKNDTLQRITSDCCDAVELHESTMNDGVMRMRKLDALPVTSGVPVDIMGEHGNGASMHVMLIGVHKPYKIGQKIRLAFHFANAGKHVVAFTVVDRATQEHGAATGGSDDAVHSEQHHH